MLAKCKGFGNSLNMLIATQLVTFLTINVKIFKLSIIIIWCAHTSQCFFIGSGRICKATFIRSWTSLLSCIKDWFLICDVNNELGKVDVAEKVVVDTQVVDLSNIKDFFLSVVLMFFCFLLAHLMNCPKNLTF